MRFFLFFFLFISPALLFAQIDSSDYDVDTLYVKEPPVIIKSEYYLPPTNPFKESRLFVAAGFAIGKKNKSPEDIRFSMFLMPSIEVGKKFGDHVSVSMGISGLNFKQYVERNEKVLKEFERNYTVTDTLDVYYQIIGGNKTPYYVTEPRDTVEKYIVSKDSSIKASTKLSYLLIPVKVNYAFHKHRFYMSLGVGFISAFLINNSPITDEKLRKSIPPNSFFLLSGDLGLGLKISKSISGEITIQSVKNLTRFGADAVSNNFFPVFTGCKLIYFFN